MKREYVEVDIEVTGAQAEFSREVQVGDGAVLVWRADGRLRIGIETGTADAYVTLTHAQALELAEALRALTAET